MSEMCLIGLRFAQVQRFIAAARSLRDMASGSALIGQMVEGAALTLAQQGGQLVFPSPQSMGSAQGSGHLIAPRRGVGNKLVAVVAADAAGVAVEAVRQGMRQQLLAEAQRLLDQHPGWREVLDEDRLWWQLEDAVELEAAWVPLAPGSDEAYALAYKQLQGLLDARKRSRLFAAMPGRQDGELVRRAPGRRAVRAEAPALSPLDGRNESVVKSPELAPRAWMLQCESLDAIAWLKRARATTQGFPSLMRVALQPWLSLQAPEDIQQWDQHMRVIERALPEAVSKAHVARGPLAALSWDGEVLHPQPRKRAREQLADAAGKLERGVADRALEALNALPQIPDGVGRYVAILFADGDQLGQALSTSASPAKHEAIAHALADFARQCDGMVEHHGGACVYAGGDDVLAFCAPDQALALARGLAVAYRQHLNPCLPGATMSVGVAIAHVSTPLRELRHLGARANQLAKAGHHGHGLRNALAVMVAPRGGSEVSVVSEWAEDTQGTGLDDRINLWRSLMASQQLTLSTAYELADLLRQWHDSDHNNILRLEAKWLLAARLSADGYEQSKHFLSASTDGVSLRTHLKRLADELYVARWLNQHICQAPQSEPMAS